MSRWWRVVLAAYRASIRAQVCWLALVGLAYLASSVEVTNVHLMDAPGLRLKWPPPPYILPSKAEQFRFAGRVHFGFASLPRVTLFGDDCIQSVLIDDTPIYQTAVCAPCANCSYTSFVVPADLAHGDHDLFVEGRNLGGPGAFDIREGGNFPPWIFALMAIAGSAALASASRARAAILVAFAAGLLGIIYFEATSPSIRSHDFVPHILYLEHVAWARTLPMPGGYETHQPPAYYAFSAFLKQVLLRRWFSTAKSYQLIALTFFLSSVGLGVSLWRRLREPLANHPWAYWAGLGCFLFIPAHVFLSATVNNDVVLPFIGTAVIALCWRYLERPSPGRAFALGFACAAAVGSKLFTTGLPLAAFATVAWEARASRQRIPTAIGRLALALGPTAAVIAGWIGRNFYYLGEAIGAPNSGKEQLVENSWGKYFSFLFQPYLHAEGLNTYGDRIRMSYPTSFLTTVLTGEYGFAAHPAALISLERLFFFVPVVAAIVGAIWGYRSSVRLWLPCVTAASVGFVTLTYVQFSRPYACNQDARYIASVFFPVAVLVSLGFRELERMSPAFARFVLRPALAAFGLLLGLFWMQLVFAGD